MTLEPEHRPALHKKHIARLQRERRQTRLILYTFIIILVAVIGLLVYGYLDQNYLQLQRPVARAGEADITVQEFEARVRLQRQQLISNYNLYLQYQQFGLDVASQLQQIQASLDDPLSIGESVLNQMIDEQLVRQESAKRGITVTQAEIDEAIQGSYSYYPNGTPTPTVTPTDVITPTVPAEAFNLVTRTPTAAPTSPATATAIVDTSATVELFISGSPTSAPATQTLTATAVPTSTITLTPTPYTFEGFQERFKGTVEDLSKQGFNETDYRTFFETLLLREKLLAVIAAGVAPLQEQAWGRHILVQDEAVAAATIERLNNGEDFAAVAREVSRDPGSAANGGDLGWFAHGVMVDSFEEVAFTLAPGQISAPVKSDFGWHIIQVIARQERPLTHEEYESARQAAFQEWLTAARAQYGVETFDAWKARVPTEPSFASAATEAVNAEQTARAEANQRPASTTTPAPQ